jgi:YVTN family beta-propeller protein
VTPINVATNTAGTPIVVGPLGSEFTATAITPDGKTAYVSNRVSGSVTPINVATNTAGTPIKVGSGPEGIAITPDGKTAYVSNDVSGSVTPINVATNMAGTSIKVGSGPEAIAITPDGKTAYVSNDGSGSVTPINLATNTAGAPIKVGVEPGGIAIAPGGGTAYVANWHPGELTPIGLASNTPGTPIGLGGEVGAVAIVPDSGPAAAFSALSAPAGQATSLDGSGSSDPEGTVTSYAWNFGDGTSATTSSAKLSHVYAQPGSYTVTLTVTDSEGCSSVFLFTGQTAYCSAGAKAITSQVLTVAPAPTTTTALPAGISPLPAPVISAARQSASRWREGKALARISSTKRPPIGTTFSFSLNEQASVNFSFTQLLSGRKVGRNCVAQTRSNARRKPCTRTVTAGPLTFAGHSSTNTVVFQGLLSRSQRLMPGPYTLVITATNSVGARSAPVSLKFTIVR